MKNLPSISEHIDEKVINKVIQNRLLEKNFINNLNIKTTNYKSIKSKIEIESNKNLIPGLLKTCTLGYDGKGQFKIDSINDLKDLNLETDVFLGIRPEHINTNGDGEIKLDIKVDLVENLGFEKIIYAKFKGQEIRIKTSNNISQNLQRISFQKNKIFLFDNNKKRFNI